MSQRFSANCSTLRNDFWTKSWHGGEWFFTSHLHTFFAFDCLDVKALVLHFNHFDLRTNFLNFQFSNLERATDGRIAEYRSIDHGNYPEQDSGNATRQIVSDFDCLLTEIKCNQIQAVIWGCLKTQRVIWAVVEWHSGQTDRLYARPKVCGSNPDIRKHIFTVESILWVNERIDAIAMVPIQRFLDAL